MATHKSLFIPIHNIFHSRVILHAIGHNHKISCRTETHKIVHPTSMQSPEDPDDYRSDMDDDHDLVTDIDSETLIRIVKFLKRGKAPGPDNIHNEVLRLGTTTSLFHHLARLFTSSIQIGCIPTACKLYVTET